MVCLHQPLYDLPVNRRQSAGARLNRGYAGDTSPHLSAAICQGSRRNWVHAH